MPIRRTVNRRELAKEFTQPREMAYFDETVTTLQLLLAPERGITRGFPLNPSSPPPRHQRAGRDGAIAAVW
jgi:hypothetical protein